MCGCEFKDNKDKVRDHDHRTGKFRGAAHNKCNINYFSNRYLPIVFHNLRGYDSHLIIKKAYDIAELKLFEHKPQFKVIPNSTEKFMSFDIGSLKFIDSFQFMASSLESLVENLKDETYSNFNCMRSVFPDHLELLCQKGSILMNGLIMLKSLNFKDCLKLKSFTHVYHRNTSQKITISMLKMFMKS